MKLIPLLFLLLVPFSIKAETLNTANRLESLYGYRVERDAGGKKLIPLLARPVFTFGVTYYVRPDGSPNCTGLVNAAYSGSGLNQPCAFSDLQQAINIAKRGDVIALAAGTVHTGNYNLIDKGSCTGAESEFITITTSDPSGTPTALSGYPQFDVRITSQMAAKMPTVRTPNAYPAFWVNPRAACYRIEGLNITSTIGANTIRLVGNGEAGVQSPADYPSYLQFMRNWFHPAEEDGSPLTAATLNRSAENTFYLEASHVILRQNAMQGFVRKYPDGTVAATSNLLAGAFGENYLIENNLMEAQTYGVFFGGHYTGWVTQGATVSNCTATSCVFSNVTGLTVGKAFSIGVYRVEMGGQSVFYYGSGYVKSIAGNTVSFNPLCNSNNTGGNGNACRPFDANNLVQIPADGNPAQWEGLQVNNIILRRNLFRHRQEWANLIGYCGGKGYHELKSGQKIWFDGNVFEGCDGFTITARNQGGGTPWNDLDNLKVTNNYFKNGNNVINAVLSDSGNLTNPSRNVLFHNNLGVGLYLNPGSTDGYASTNFSGGVNVTVTHNTNLHGNYRDFVSFAPNVMSGLVMRDNIFRAAPNGCFDYSSGQEVGALITTCWPSAEVRNNVLMSIDRWRLDEIAHWWTNHFPNNKVVTSIAAVGFTAPDAGLTAAGNYRPAPGGPLDKKATDGTDIGVNYPELIAALGFDPNSGQPLPSPTPSPTPAPSPTPIATPTPTPIGITWQKMAGSPEAVQTLAFIGSTLYVGTKGNGVYAYDGNWTQVNDGLPSLPRFIGNFHVTRAGSLLASMWFAEATQSTTWRLSGGVWTESAGGRNYLASFYVSDREGNILASTNSSSVMRSTDDGKTFELFSTVPAVNGVSSTSFSIGAGVDGTIYLYSHDTGLHYSTDNGRTWVSLGAVEGPFGNQTALTSNAQGQMIAATGFGAIYRNRGSLSLPSIQLEKDLRTSNEAGAHSLIRLANGILVSHFIRLYCSKDGGDTWQLCDTGIPAGTTSGTQNLQSVFAGDLAQGPDGQVYVGFLDAGVGVYRTTSGTPTPIPTPSPTPSPTPTPVPDGTVPMVLVLVREGAGGDIPVIGALVTVNNQSALSREGDGLAWFTDKPTPLGATITATKAGYEFPKATVVEGTVEQLYFLHGRAVAQPSPTPAPTPVPTPSPQPTPSPLPSPLPSCEMAITAPPIAAWSSGTLTVSLSGPLPQTFSVSAVGTSGQIVVMPPTTQSFSNRTSLTTQFKLQAKKKSAEVVVSGPCGSKRIMVLIQ